MQPCVQSYRAWVLVIFDQHSYTHTGNVERGKDTKALTVGADWPCPDLCAKVRNKQVGEGIAFGIRASRPLLGLAFSAPPVTSKEWVGGRTLSVPGFCFTTCACFVFFR